MLKRKMPSRTRRRQDALWQVLELLNNHLRPIPQGMLLVEEDIVIHADGLITRQRHSRSEDMLCDDTGLWPHTCGGLEMHASRLPPERVGHGTRGGGESH